ncbi:transcriptional regulator [Pantoea stewartii]|uniref:XRE family transcriptional regulator n=1 Tax=Pantoea stewartii subsp. stewartii DC283 TaxID=660596 RepID=A0ABN4Z741_PANSE|nr:transcriptional regulator [Pantoea stewartii]ARF52159.1 hypothetical protein DSJ_23120 [Pantoea stewartii subsp. stewartii DC283]EAA7440432.1 transcriptional regulator [Salmonella enterica subsp. enterica]KAB0545644.1 transcriptional regulator [Pantoea stewartii subsp. stewartii]
MRIRFTLTEGFDKIYHPLRFQAFWNDQGYCYLRVQIAQGKIVFTCAQLLNYYNTSITNAAESVRISAINALIQDGALKVSNRKNFSDLFKSEQRKSREFDAWIFDYINENSVWIEYYHPEISLNNDHRYTTITFEGNHDPVWFSTSRKSLEEKYPGLEFAVDENLLRNWVGAKLTVSDIKNLLKERNWTMKEVAERWRRSESWMSKIVNDPDRDPYWEDAFKGLPLK